MEDEEHFLLLCKNNETLRNILFKDLLFWKNNETLRNILFKDLLFWKYNEILRNILFKDLMFWKYNETLRNILFQDIAEENSNFIDYSNFEKLIILLNTQNFFQVKRPRSFNKQSLEQWTVSSYIYVLFLFFFFFFMFVIVFVTN